MDDLLLPVRSAFGRTAACGLAILLITTGSASAATLRSFSLVGLSVPHANSHRVNVLNQFLAGGVDHWINEKPPRIPPGVTIRYADGVLKNTPLVAYLDWRQAQDPTFFDNRHPRLAYVLSHAPRAATSTALAFSSTGAMGALSVSYVPPTSSTTTALEQLVPGAASGQPVFEAQEIVPSTGTPAAVPEPGSVLAVALLFGAAACWRRRTVEA